MRSTRHGKSSFDDKTDAVGMPVVLHLKIHSPGLFHMVVRGGVIHESREHYAKIPPAQIAKKNRLLNPWTKRAIREEKHRIGSDKINQIR